MVSDASKFVVDSSIIVAILLREPGCIEFERRMIDADWVGIGTTTLMETYMVMAGRLGNEPRPLIESLLNRTNYEVLPFTADHLRIAQDTFFRYGKGRHSAALNYGDCMAYATARLAGRPLLYAGDDFAQTDAAPA